MRHVVAWLAWWLALFWLWLALAGEWNRGEVVAASLTAAAVVLAALMAGGALYRRRLPGAVAAAAERLLLPPVAVLKAVHSGVVGDYVTWVVVGVVFTGGAWAVLLH